MRPELYHDTKRGLLVYKTGNPALVTSHVPEARQLNGAYVALPDSLRNIQLVAQLDYPIPAIMDMKGYDWPIERGRTPLLHQKIMANWMVANCRGFNLSDMGTMKTLAALWAADFIMREEGGCAVIVAPLSVLQTVWGHAIVANFLGKRSYRIVHGSAQTRERILAEIADFYIINHDGLCVGSHTRKRFELDGLSKALAARSDITIAIVDEASAYRDAATRRHRVARQIIGQRAYLWLLSGTPTSNGPCDAYGLSKLVNNAYGESFTSFHRRTMLQIGQFKWVPRPGAMHEAKKLLTPSIRFDIKDVWDGPPQTTQQREVPLTLPQKKALADMKRDLMVQIKDQTITAVHEASARLKLIQISLGAIYDASHAYHLIDASPRLNELKAIIEQARGKLLCFVPLTSIVELLYKELRDSICCEAINGQVPAQRRADIFHRFQQPENCLRMLIADPGTMSHGLDLYAATTVVWYGPTDRTELYLQANKRAHRPGQRHPVTVVQLTSTALEREIYRRLEANETMQGLLLQMVRNDFDRRICR